MPYLKETFKYLKGVWWLLALLCLPAAVALGFFLRPVASLTFIPVYAVTEIGGFLDIARVVVNLELLTKIWPPFVIFAALFLMLCLTMPLIEKHFRVGRLTLDKPFSLVNNYFLPVLKIILIMTAVFVFYFVLLISLTALQHVILSGRGEPNTASVIVAAVLAVTLFLLLCWLCSPFMFMIPLMQMYGYSFGDAFTSSVSYYGANKPFRIMFGLAFAFLWFAAIGIVVQVFARFIPGWAHVLIATAMHLFLLVYFCAYCMVTTFRITGMERKDNKTYGV